MLREVSDLPEGAQQERGRAGFEFMEGKAYSRMPLLQLTPSGPALCQVANPMLPIS